MTIETFKEMLTEISGGEEYVGTMDARMAGAASSGFMDARTMVDLMQTHGFPLSLCAVKAVAAGLAIDFGGLRLELERIGKKPSTIDSELKEVKYFVANAASTRKDIHVGR